MTGAGPKIALTTLPFLAAAIVALVWGPSATTLHAIPRALSLSLGWALLLAGVALYLATVRTFLRDFPRGVLITTGPYRYCRNPLYASVGAFILPGLSFVLDSWALLPVSVVVLAASALFCPEEEQHLEEAFGDQYRAYKAHTHPFFPLPH